MDKTIQIDWSTIDKMLQFDVHYDEKADILLIQSKERRPSVSVDCDGEYWVRVDPQTGEILGLEIEDFKRVFLKKHREILKAQTTYVRPIADLIQLERCAV